MRIIALLLFLIPPMLFAQLEPKITIHNNDPAISVQSKVFSRSASELGVHKKQARTQFFPTQVFRREGTLEAYYVTCDEFIENAFHVFDDLYKAHHISSYMFFSCSMHLEDSKALRFNMWANFDPLTDEAINLLQNFIAQKNGIDFYGRPLNIEPVTAVVTSVTLNVGTFIPPMDQIVKRTFHIDSKFYFDSLVDMNEDFLGKIWPDFFSTDEGLIKAFLAKWFPNYVDDDYLTLLSESNYIGINIEPIFIFSKAPKAVTPFKRYTICSKTKKGICKPLRSEPKIEW